MGYSTLKAALDAVVRTNGQQQITGANLNGVMTQILQGVDILDRANPADTSGMNQVVLRKDTSFASQVSGINTIYEVRDSFDLGGASVTIPAGSCIKFVGGSISNGTLVLSSNVLIDGGTSLSNPNYNLEIKTTQNVENVVIRNVRFTGNKTIEGAINRTGQEYVTNLEVCGCVISGYSTRGINLNAKNALYDGNLVYDCGTNETREHAVDLCAGYVSVEAESKTPNIIITNNRLLSNMVDRHIDVGELYSETNIIISNNVCVGMKSDLSAEEPNSLNRHGILVGYAGTSTDTDRFAIISNNIVKYGTWSGIYVRANSSVSTIGISKYRVNIVGNIISGIIGETANVVAAIAVEVKEGSIISNNNIDNSSHGISLGFMYTDMDAIVESNTIHVSGIGVSIDTICKKLKVANNQIKAGEKGIVVSPSSSSSDDVYDAKLDIQGNNIDSLECVRIYNTTIKMIVISGNTLLGNTLTDSYGILYHPHNVDECCVIITENSIRNKNRGIRVLRSGYKMDVVTMANNQLIDCNQAISAENGNSTLCMPAFNNKFDNCTAPLGAGIYSGFKNPDGTLVLFNLPSLPNDQNTTWKRGDVVFGNPASNAFKVAFCCVAATLDSNNAPVANTAKWLVIGLNLDTTNRESLKTQFYDGTICYDRTLNKAFVLAAGQWVTYTIAQ